MCVRLRKHLLAPMPKSRQLCEAFREKEYADCSSIMHSVDEQECC